MKKPYSSYAQQALRFFSRREKPDSFKSLAEEQNWAACEAAISSFNDYDRDLILKIYLNPDTLADNIYGLSQERNLPQDMLWKLVGEVEKAFAEQRGLI